VILLERRDLITITPRSRSPSVRQGRSPFACCARTLDRFADAGSDSRVGRRVARRSRRHRGYEQRHGLIQLLQEHSRLNVIGRHPKDDKETRLCRHQGRFEAGRILLPVEASWLADFENELLAFPYGKHDDQVDAFMLFLDWFSEMRPTSIGLRLCHLHHTRRSGA
jgi:predicted phage terminase large subunit-like protein